MCKGKREILFPNGIQSIFIYYDYKNMFVTNNNYYYNDDDYNQGMVCNDTVFCTQH